MKVIDFLVKVANGEIKEHTFFRRVGIVQYVHSKEVDKYEYIGNSHFMIWFKDKDSEPINYNVILNIELDEEVEIIEEIEKPKEIKEINFRNEKGETLIGANMWEFYYRLDDLRKAVNYLLKKEDDKE